MSVKASINEATLIEIKDLAVSIGHSGSDITPENKLEDDLGITDILRLSLSEELDDVCQLYAQVGFNVGDIFGLEKVKDVQQKVLEIIVKAKVLKKYKIVSDYINSSNPPTVKPSTNILNDLNFSSERKADMSDPLSHLLHKFGAQGITRAKASSFTKVSDAQGHVWGKIE